MREYTESYPTVYIGQILAYPLYGGPQDHHQRAFNVHPGNQSSSIVSRVRQVQKGHTVTYIQDFSRVIKNFVKVQKWLILTASRKKERNFIVKT